MERRFRPRQRQSPRPAVRTILVAGTASFILLGVVAAVIWQTFRKETADAGLPKMVSRITLSQPVNEIYKGTFSQPVLCFLIETNGEGKPPELHEIELSLSGTKPAIRQALSNPQIYITSEPYFQPVRAIPLTGLKTTGPLTEIHLSHALEQKSTYLWITFDVSNRIDEENAAIVAGCHRLTIGTLDHEPIQESNTNGTKILPYKTWYSKASGDISALTSWNSERDGSGKTLDCFSKDQQAFFIQSGSVLTNHLNGCLPHLIIEKGGTLQSSSTIRALSTTVQSGGIWNQTSPFPDKALINKTTIETGGNYIHMNSGAVPGKEKHFMPGSVLWMNDVSGIDSTKQQWGNVIIDIKEKKQKLCLSALSRISGSLDIRSGNITLTGSDSILISKDLLLSGGTLTATTPGNTSIIDVRRNLMIKGGGLTDAGVHPHRSGQLKIYVSNGIEISDGKVKLGNQSALVALSTFTRPLRWTQNAGEVTLGNIVIPPGSAMIIEGNQLGPIGQGSTFSVMHHGRLDAGKSSISGKGTFLLNKEALIATAHPEGICSGDVRGCIITSVRIFSSEAAYVYSSKDPAQRSGNFKAIPEKNTVGVLRILKNSHEGILVLERDFKVTGSYSLIHGTLIENGFKIEDGAEPVATGKNQPGISAR